MRLEAANEVEFVWGGINRTFPMGSKRNQINKELFAASRFENGFLLPTILEYLAE